jgi:hypothetical protein
MLARRVYISNFSGLGNRLESLVLAGMIEHRHGHQIVLDWPERGCLEVTGTRWGTISPWRRIGARKIRDFDEPILAGLGRIRTINLRATYGPRALQQHYLQPAAARLRPDPRIAQAIRWALAPFGDRPAIGVHIRHGDFHVPGDSYDARVVRHPGVPLWWYEYVMQRALTLFPSVFFVTGYSGASDTLERLRARFPIVTLPNAFGYRPLLAGHVSEGHPVVDMFALACCSVLVASPTSSFSHWAANMLGPPSATLLPPPRMTRAAPACGVARLAGRVLLDWRDAAEQGADVLPVLRDEDFPRPTEARTEWL